MFRLVVTLFALLAGAALANEGGDGSIRARSLAAAAGALPSQAAVAPFRAAAYDPMPKLVLREELSRRGPGGSCEASASDLCYDLRDARIVYRPARRYMPAIEGLRAESISLRRDRLVLKYSFR
ncbi:MAG TPA: hypothetical protein VFK48_00415 [Usitatibacter sp.]|nr:hypothetical protein [Usitatibacter sp.]